MTEIKENLPLPFDDDGYQKAFTGGFLGSNIFGLPIQAGGLDRKSNFAFTKRGVAIAYMTVPVLKSAVDVISENLASLPMVLKNKEGKIVIRSDGFGYSDSKFLNAIERSYSHYGIPLFQLWGTALLLYGENYTEKVPNTTQRLFGLKWLNPLAMSIETSTEQDKSEIMFRGETVPYRIRRKYFYSGQEGYLEYDESEILFSRNFNPLDDFRGFSSALSALAKASISMEFENFTLAFYDNNGHPGLIVSPRDKLVGMKEVTDWQNSWREEFRGAHNQFKTHINSFPFDVTTFDVLDVSKPLEVSKDAESKILSAFRVPPEMIGMTSDNAYQFSKETKNGFMQTAVRPLALSIANAINHSGILQEFGDERDLKFSFDFSEFDAKGESDAKQQDILERQVKSASMSLGDYQRATGNPISPNADNVYMIPQGFIFVDKDTLGKPDEIPNPNDQTGPEASTLNQSERRTQSTTEDQDSVDFFGSKGLAFEDEDFEIDGDVAPPLQKTAVNKSFDEISLEDIEKVAKEKGITFSKALDLLQVFEND